MTKTNDPFTEFRINDLGDIEEIDLRTNELISSSRDVQAMSFSSKKANEVCDLISSGATLRELSSRSDMPDLKTVQRWKYMYPLFKDKLEAARKNFAEMLVDDAVMAGREALSAGKDEVPGLKANIDVNLKVAEKFDRERFGNQTKVVGDINQPVSFKLVTGIPSIAEIEQEEAIEAQYKEVEDGENVDGSEETTLSVEGTPTNDGEDDQEEASEWED